MLQPYLINYMVLMTASIFLGSIFCNFCKLILSLNISRFNPSASAFLRPPSANGNIKKPHPASRMELKD